MNILLVSVSKIGPVRPLTRFNANGWLDYDGPGCTRETFVDAFERSLWRALGVGVAVRPRIVVPANQIEPVNVQNPISHHLPVIHVLTFGLVSIVTNAHSVSPVQIVISVRHVLRGPTVSYARLDSWAPIVTSAHRVLRGPTVSHVRLDSWAPIAINVWRVSQDQIVRSAHQVLQDLTAGNNWAVEKNVNQSATLAAADV